MKIIISFLLVALFSFSAMAGQFKLVSEDISDGVLMPKAQEFIGFGCKGGNLSPQLSWTGAPAGTKSFALTVYDPDAPTGSGWWHWQIVNINKSTTELKRGAGNIQKNLAPQQSLQIESDYGSPGFGGACPPQGAKAHRYQFTLYALSVERLNLSPTSSGALVGFMIKSNTLGSTTIQTLYKR